MILVIAIIISVFAWTTSFAVGVELEKDKLVSQPRRRLVQIIVSITLWIVASALFYMAGAA